MKIPRLTACARVGLERDVLRLYLDQFAWIQLARAAHRRRNATEAAFVALDVIRYGVAHDLLSCPLSAQHYMETLVRREPKSRHRLATVMAELSRFDTMAPPRQVLSAELDAALFARFGKPADRRELKVFGRGAAFAFGEPDYRYRVPTEAKLAPEAAAEFEAAANYFIQLRLLTGPTEGDVPGMVENDFYRRFGERYAAGQARLAEGLRAESDRSSTERWTTASELIDIIDPLNEAFARAGITKEESTILEAAPGLTELLRSLPSRRTALELRLRQHANPTTRWANNDLNDLGALSVAIPYCDVVVAEKQWRHFAVAAGLDSTFETRIISSLADLPPLLV